MRTYQVWAVIDGNSLCYQDEDAESKTLAIKQVMDRGGMLPTLVNQSDAKLVAKRKFLWFWL